MSIDVAFQRFRDANPVPNPAALQQRQVDSDVFVASTQQRSMHMQSTKTDHVDLEPPRRRPRIGSALAIAAALVVVGFGVGMLTSDRTGNQAAAGLEQRVALVAAQAAAYSDGDFDGWVSYYTPDASLGNGLTAGGPDIKILFSVSAAANEQWVITGLCQQGASPEQSSCPMRQRNDFHGPAGLDVEALYTFTFDEDDKIVAYELDQGRAIANAPFNTFDIRFVQWLAEAHPEVALDSVMQANLSGGVLMTAESMATALLYVDEFIAQSDDYPIQQDDAP